MVLAPIVRGPQGRVRQAARGAAGRGLHAGQDRRRAAPARRGDRARQEVQARHRDRGRPPGDEGRAAQAAGRLDRDRGGAGRRARRDRAGRHRRASRPTRRSSPVRCTGRAWSSSSRASSASTRRTGRACAARGSGSQMEIDPELVVPDPTLSIGEGAIAPWAASASDYYDQLIQAIAERYDVDLDTPWEELPDQATGLLPVRDQRRPRAGHLPEPVRPAPVVRDHVRRDHPEPRAALPRDRVRAGAREDRGVHDAAPVPGLQGRSPAAGIARGAGRRHGRFTSSRRCRPGARSNGSTGSSCRSTTSGSRAWCCGRSRSACGSSTTSASGICR